MALRESLVPARLHALAGPHENEHPCVGHAHYVAGRQVRALFDLHGYPPTASAIGGTWTGREHASIIGRKAGSAS